MLRVLGLIVGILFIAAPWFKPADPKLIAAVVPPGILFIAYGLGGEGWVRVINPKLVRRPQTSRVTKEPTSGRSADVVAFFTGIIFAVLSIGVVRSVFPLGAGMALALAFAGTATFGLLLRRNVGRIFAFVFWSVLLAIEVFVSASRAWPLGVIVVLLAAAAFGGLMIFLVYTSAPAFSRIPQGERNAHTAMPDELDPKSIVSKHR